MASHFSLSYLYFSFQTCVGVVTNSHTAESMLGCLDIASANKIIPQTLILASGKFIRQRLKAATEFGKISQEFLSVSELLSLKAFGLGLHIALNTAVFQAPIKVALRPHLHHPTAFLVQSPIK